MPKPATPVESKIEPKPELEKRIRRIFTAEYKLSIIQRADACKHGEVGELLRREKLYSNQLAQWRRELAEQGVDAPQIVLLELQLLVDNRGADATANQQQGDDAYHKGQLPVIAGCIRTARQCVANDEVSAEQAACSKHAQGIFE